ncbi:MAG: LamG-like jellyroll fold domain-containing protein [Planctomycetota bacterium]
MATNAIDTPAPHVVQATYDFESGDLTGWTVAPNPHGDDLVFATPGNQPAAQPHSGSYEPNTIQGSFWVRTWEGEVLGTGDGHTGIVQTDPFVVDHGAKIDLMVGGGNHPFRGDPDAPNANMTAITLEREAGAGDWEAVKTVSGRNVNFLSPVTWDLSGYAGDTVRLRLYDTATGGWGHVAADRLLVSATGPQVVGAWNFDDGTASDSADSHHGVFRGDAAPAAGGLGGQALRLDGSGDYVDAGRWDHGGELTASLWVHPDNVADNWTGFFCSNSVPGEKVFWLGQHATDGHVRFGNYLDNTNETPLDTGRVVLGNGKWQHVTATYDGHHQRIYVNGTLMATSPDRNTVQPSGDAPLWLGRTHVYFDGMLDEAQLRNYAVDAGDVRALMGPVVAQFGELELDMPPAGRATWGYTAIDGTGKLGMDVPGGHDIWVDRGLAPALLAEAPAGDFGFETQVATNNQPSTIGGLVVWNDATDNFAYNYGWARYPAFGGGAQPPHAALYRPGQQMAGRPLGQDNAILRFEKVGDAWIALHKPDAAEPFWHSAGAVTDPALADYRIGLLGKAWRGNSLQADFDYFRTVAVRPPVASTSFSRGHEGWTWDNPGGSTYDLTSRPGSLHLHCPSGLNMWTSRAGAPILYTAPMPNRPGGDFFFQAHVEVDNPVANGNAIGGLAVLDLADNDGNNYDLYWGLGHWGGNDQLFLQGPGFTHGLLPHPDDSDVYLKLLFDSEAELWRAYWKDLPEDEWTEFLDGVAVPGLDDPRVGLFGKTGGNAGQPVEFYFDDFTQIPEPTSLALLALGGFAAALRRRRS